MDNEEIMSVFGFLVPFLQHLLVYPKVAGFQSSLQDPVWP